MVKLDIKMGCTHQELDKNVIMNTVESDDNFICFECPECKRQVVLIYSLEV
jgi:hypothetical protein